MAYASKPSISHGLPRFQPTKGNQSSSRPSKVLPEFVASTRPMTRARKMTRTTLHCCANSESQPERSLLHDLTQGLPLTSHMLDAKVKEAALQNSALMAGRRQDAVRLQQLVDTDTQLRTTVAQQAVMIAEQAETIDRQKKVLAHSERHASIISRLLSKLQGRRKVETAELDHIASDSHVELLVEEKQGLQKTLEETEDELAKERQRSEYAMGEAQHRGTKRQELQEARDHEERLKNQMHARWVQALEEVEMLKAAMIYGHFLFETLMKGPLQADFNTHAQEQTPALEDEDLYV